MLLAPNVIEGPYVQDILHQPRALHESLNGFEDSAELRGFAQAIGAGQYNRIVLTGMGSSLHALYPLHLRFTGLGLPSLITETSELIHYFPGVLDQKTLAIVVSQSGQSAEVVRFLAMAKGRAHVIGVTNNEDSPLARLSQARISIRAGVEATVSCKTYVATLLAIEWLAAVLIGDELSHTRTVLYSAIPAVETYLSGWRQHVESLSALLTGIKQIFVTGRGPSLSTALTAGLILKESTRFSAEGMSSAAFRHGPFETLADHVLVVIVAGDERARLLNQRLADDIESAGGKAALIDSTASLSALRIPEAPELIRPILEILPLQMLTLALAARSGREAGRFELATKVTAVE